MFFCVRALFAWIILNCRMHLAKIQRCYILWLVSNAPFTCICMRHLPQHLQVCSELGRHRSTSTEKGHSAFLWDASDPGAALLLGISLILRASTSTHAGSSALCWMGRPALPSGAQRCSDNKVWITHEESHMLTSTCMTPDLFKVLNRY